MTAYVSACGQTYRDHVWSYDFVHHRRDDGRALRTLNLIDEHTRECLTMRVKRKLNSTDVIDTLTDLFMLRGIPAYIRSDNGPEFVAQAVRDWVKAVGAKTAYIETRLALGERILRVLQCPLQGRTAEWGGLLPSASDSNHHRTIEETLQHHQTTPCFGLPPANPENHHPNRPKASHALTFKLDLLTGAVHVPAGFSADGLPMGLQVVGHRFDDLTVMRIGAALEKVLCLDQARPGI